MAEVHTAYVALGSNRGVRSELIREALQKLRARGIHIDAVSSLIETAPVGGPPGQRPYLNGAACLKTLLEPRELLRTLLEVERELGRTRDPNQRNAPRTIDLDLLLFDDLELKAEGLCVPHPRMHERTFVLKPLAQIAPKARHPSLGGTVAELLAALEKGRC